jgi:pyrroline-5-carboxylate reductase
MALFSAGRSRAIRVPEAALDAITAVSGSGPAYLFYLAEGMTAAALELGLSDEQADTLVRQTLLGSAELLAASAESAGELRRRVTSPGGTTEAAIRHLDGNASRQVIVNALKAAADRSRELGA